MDPGAPRLLVAVNRDIDVLENELAHRRIDGAEYQAGRALQRAFEIESTIGSTNWRGASSHDPRQKEDAIAARIDSAIAQRQAAEAVIGTSGVAFLQPVLLHGLGFAEYARRSQAKGSRADTARVADHFRRLLKYLAEGTGATGPRHSRIRSWRDPDGA